MTLGKKELVAHLAKTTDLTQDKVTKVLDGAFDWIRDSLKSGEDIRFIGFGSFAVQKIAARAGITLEQKKRWILPLVTEFPLKAARN